MATYKFDGIQRFGKFYGTFYKANAAKPDPLKNNALSDAKALSDYLRAQIAEGGLVEDEDSIIFRGVDYEDFEQLLREVRMSTY